MPRTTISQCLIRSASRRYKSIPSRPYISSTKRKMISLLAGTYCLVSGLKVLSHYRKGLSDDSLVKPLENVTLTHIKKGHIGFPITLSRHSYPVEIIGVGAPTSMKTITKASEGAAYDVKVPFTVSEYRFDKAYLSGNLVSPCRKTIAFQYAFKRRMPLSVFIFICVFLPFSIYDLGMYKSAIDDLPFMLGMAD